MQVAKISPWRRVLHYTVSQKRRPFAWIFTAVKTSQMSRFIFTFIV